LAPVIDDCDDSDNAINPGAKETADNGVDEDCDGFDLKTWYQDSDLDSYGDPNVTQLSNTMPVGYVSDNMDCNDSESNAYPGNTEVCDGIDNNCDGQVDEGFSDTDGDGVPDCIDVCPNFDDTIDSDGDGIPDGCDNPLDIKKFKLNTLTIKPNPFSNIITISVPKGYENDNFNIYLFDLNGRLVFKEIIMNINGIIDVNNLDQLQAGVYFIKIIVNTISEEVVIKQLIKY
jgi:hypothetical protein